MYKRHCWTSIYKQVVFFPNTIRYINSSVARTAMNCDSSFDIFLNCWLIPSFLTNARPVVRITSFFRLLRLLLTICNKMALLWHLKKSRKRRSLAQPVFSTCPRPFRFCSLPLREVNHLTHDVYSAFGAPQVRYSHSSATPVQLNRPTFATTWLGLVHCLDLEGATDRFIGWFETRLSVLYPYFLILQRID